MTYQKLKKIKFKTTPTEFLIENTKGKKLIVVARDKAKDKNIDIDNKEVFKPQLRVKHFKILESLKGTGLKDDVIKVLEVGWYDSLTIELMLTHFISEWFSPIHDIYNSSTQNKVEKKHLVYFF